MHPNHVPRLSAVRSLLSPAKPAPTLPLHVLDAFSTLGPLPARAVTPLRSPYRLPAGTLIAVACLTVPVAACVIAAAAVLTGYYGPVA